jgi:transcription termination/antitermination protein NusA
VVPDEQLSLAIGRRGQNVRLASQLTGLDIDIMTEEEESQRRQAEFAERTKLFMDTLDLDEILRAAAGLRRLHQPRGSGLCRLDELLVIDGVDESTANELQARARDYIEEEPQGAGACAKELGVEDSLIDFEGLTPQMLEALARMASRRSRTSPPAPTGNWPAAGRRSTASASRTRACSRSST